MNSCREIFDEIMLENLDRKKPRCRHLKGTWHYKRTGISSEEWKIKKSNGRVKKKTEGKGDVEHYLSIEECDLKNYTQVSMYLSRETSCGLLNKVQMDFCHRELENMTVMTKKKPGLGYVKKPKMNILKRDDLMKKTILGVHDRKSRYHQYVQLYPS